MEKAVEDWEETEDDILNIKRKDEQQSMLRTEKEGGPPEERKDALRRGKITSR